MAWCSVTDAFVCRCEGPYTCQLHLWALALVFVCTCTCLCRTEVHVHSTGALGIGHVLVNRVKYLLLHLGDGITVEHLYWNLRTVLVVWVHTVQDLYCVDKRTGENKRENLLREIGEQRKRQEVSYYCLCPAWGFVQTGVSLEHSRSFEKPFPLSLASQNLISHLRRDTNFQLCRGIST